MAETKRLIYFLNKANKKYISDPAKAPAGKQVHQGERGGYFYYREGREKAPEEEKKPPKEEPFNVEDKIKKIYKNSDNYEEWKSFLQRTAYVFREDYMKQEVIEKSIKQLPKEVFKKCAVKILTYGNPSLYHRFSKCGAVYNHKLERILICNNQSRKTIIHELGHAFANGEYNSTTPWQVEMTLDKKMTLDNEYYTEGKGKAQEWISNYSKRNPAEYFAECFAYYFLDEERRRILKTVDPIGHNMIEEACQVKDGKYIGE